MGSPESKKQETPAEIFGRALAGSIPPTILDCFGSMVEQLGWRTFLAQEDKVSPPASSGGAGKIVYPEFAEGPQKPKFPPSLPCLPVSGGSLSKGQNFPRKIC